MNGKKTIVILVLLSLGFQGSTQSNFPASWLGSYAGKMQIENLSGIVDSVDVFFDLLPAKEKNHWTYRMTYNSNKWGKMVKEYEMRWHDSLQSPNLFILDEHNGLLLTEQFINNSFYSHYEVEGQHYLTLLKKEGTGLYFEIRCTDPKAGLKTSSIPHADEGSFTVSTYFHFSVQYVHLKPVK